MKIRLVAVVALIASVLGFAPAQAAETRVVTGVSAFVRVDLGYMVGWTLPADTKGITGYTVTASGTSIKCVARGATAVQCVYPVAQLGYKNPYTFTVVANTAAGDGPASAPSNQIKYASIPWAPQQPLAKVTSDTSMDIAWVPDTNDGGVPLYGYHLNVWEMTPAGDPGAVAYDGIELRTNKSVTGLKPSTMYVINIQSCNAYGCNSADNWTFISTTGPTGLSKLRAPRIISGGSANTTCWDRVLDGGNAASTGATITKSAYKCTLPYVDPALYPKVVPGATQMVSAPLATRFAQNVSFFGFSKTYSMKEWAKTGGNNWFAYFSASSKTPVMGFTIEPTITSKTPAVCTIDGRWVKFLAPGECVLNGSVGGNFIWLPSGVATTKFTIIP
ncbi:Fibronectin type III [Candidatus Nanopelagicaceae bacterium]